MGYKQKENPINHVNSWEEEDVKRGRKLEKEGKKGHAEALFDDAHDSNRYRGGNDGSEPFHMSRELSEGGDIIDETAQRSGSFMSQHSQSSPLNKGVIDADTEDMPIDDDRMGNVTRNVRRINRLEKLTEKGGPGSKQWKRAGQKAKRWDKKAKK